MLRVTALDSAQKRIKTLKEDQILKKEDVGRHESETHFGMSNSTNTSYARYWMCHSTAILLQFPIMTMPTKYYYMIAILQIPEFYKVYHDVKFIHDTH